MQSVQAVSLPVGIYSCSFTCCSLVLAICFAPNLTPPHPPLPSANPLRAWYIYSCCTSINEIVCHGIPDSTVLEEGMIVNVDITVFYKGYHGDCSEMFTVGEVDQAGKDLIQVRDVRSARFFFSSCFV